MRGITEILRSFYFKGNRKKINKTWLIMVTAAVIFLLLGRNFQNNQQNVHYDEMIAASGIMEQALREVKKYRSDLGVAIDNINDPNETGLIGASFTEITTTAGNLEAKRTTANPNFAALLVHLLYEAGVRKGDTIALGMSSSFPGLIIATLSAARVMKLNPIIISSLGSSMWGANNPKMTWLDIYNVLYQKGIFPYEIKAVSIGGDLDIGLELNGKGRKLIVEKIKEYNLPFIYEKNLRQNVAARLQIYDSSQKNQKIKAFVNIGGAWANMGDSLKILDLKPGINHISEFPPVSERGVIFAMAERNIPIIHLLNVKGFSLKYGMPWDPVPLPKVGRGPIYYKE